MLPSLFLVGTLPRLPRIEANCVVPSYAEIIRTGSWETAFVEIVLGCVEQIWPSPIARSNSSGQN